MSYSNWADPAKTRSDRGAKVELRRFLRILGIKSADHKSELEAAIEAFTRNAGRNYGVPDHVMMSPQALKSYQKAFSKKDDT